MNTLARSNPPGAANVLASPDHPPFQKWAREDVRPGLPRQARSPGIRHAPATPTVDLDLIRKYDVAGPRYTSYPPATRFTDPAPMDRLIERIAANNRSGQDLSLYFHIPFCQALCWYCGCTTIITTQQGQSAAYLNYLKKELALMGRWLNPSRKVSQLHFGGGTPTFLLPDEIRALGQFIRAQFKPGEDAEWGVEIDPRRVNREHIKALSEVGFNRASVGVQDHNPLVQKSVHRIQPFAQTKMVVDWLREAGFRSLNLDLIYGLPRQTPATFERTLDEVLRLAPARFAVFNYAHVPWLKPTQRVLQAALPSAETKLDMLKLTVEKLTGAGYAYIGLDHFARFDDELAVAQRQKTLQRNFQGYSTRGDVDIYAFGMSSISRAGEAYWQNTRELPAYYTALDADTLPIARGYILNPEDLIRRQTIMRLLCDLELDFQDMSGRLGVDFKEHFARELDSLEDMEADGLVRIGPDALTVTGVGRLLIRNVAMRFDACLPAVGDRQFSKTI